MRESGLEEFLRIIREEEKPKEALMSAYKLSDVQATAILDLRLRQLARLEEERLQAEKSELEGEKGDIEKTLKSSRRLKKLIRDELLADAEQHGDVRRSPMMSDEGKLVGAIAFSEEDLVSNEPVTVVMSLSLLARAMTLVVTSWSLLASV